MDIARSDGDKLSDLFINPYVWADAAFAQSLAAVRGPPETKVSVPLTLIISILTLNHSHFYLSQSALSETFHHHKRRTSDECAPVYSLPDLHNESAPQYENLCLR